MTNLTPAEQLQEQPAHYPNLSRREYEQLLTLLRKYGRWYTQQARLAGVDNTHFVYKWNSLCHTIDRHYRLGVTPFASLRDEKVPQNELLKKEVAND